MLPIIKANEPRLLREGLQIIAPLDGGFFRNGLRFVSILKGPLLG